MSNLPVFITENDKQAMQRCLPMTLDYKLDGAVLFSDMECMVEVSIERNRTKETADDSVGLIYVGEIYLKVINTNDYLTDTYINAASVPTLSFLRPLVMKHIDGQYPDYYDEIWERDND